MCFRFFLFARFSRLFFTAYFRVICKNLAEIYGKQAHFLRAVVFFFSFARFMSERSSFVLPGCNLLQPLSSFRPSWRNFLPRTLAVRRLIVPNFFRNFQNEGLTFVLHWVERSPRFSLEKCCKAFYPFRRRLDLLRNFFPNARRSFFLVAISCNRFRRSVLPGGTSFRERSSFVGLFFDVFRLSFFLKMGVRRVLVLIQVASLRSATTSPRQNDQTKTKRRIIESDGLSLIRSPKPSLCSSIMFLFSCFMAVFSVSVR